MYINLGTCTYFGAYYTHYYLLCVCDRKIIYIYINIILYDGTRLSVHTHTHTHTHTHELYTDGGGDRLGPLAIYYILLLRILQLHYTGAADTSRAVITHSGAM